MRIGLLLGIWIGAFLFSSSHPLLAETGETHPTYRLVLMGYGDDSDTRKRAETQMYLLCAYIKSRKDPALTKRFSDVFLVDSTLKSVPNEVRQAMELTVSPKEEERVTNGLNNFLRSFEREKTGYDPCFGQVDDPLRSKTATKSAVVMLMATVVADVHGNPRLRLIRMAGNIGDAHRATDEIPLSSSDPSSEIVARMLAMQSDTIIDAQMSLWVPPINRCSDSARGSADCIQVGGQVKAIISIKDTPYSSRESVTIADVRSTCAKCEVVKRTYSRTASLPQWSEVPGYQVESDETVAGVRRIVITMPIRDVGPTSFIIELQDKWNHFLPLGPASIDVIPPARFTADSGHPICSYRHLNDGKSIIAYGKDIRMAILEAELPDVPIQFRDETREKLEELFYNSGDTLGYRVLNSGTYRFEENGICSEMSFESNGIAAFDAPQFCRDIEKRLTDFLKMKSGDRQTSFPRWETCDQIVAKVLSSPLQSHVSSKLTIGALDGDSPSSEYNMNIVASRGPSRQTAASDSSHPLLAETARIHPTYRLVLMGHGDDSDTRKRAETQMYQLCTYINSRKDPALTKRFSDVVLLDSALKSIPNEVRQAMYLTVSPKEEQRVTNGLNNFLRSFESENPGYNRCFKQMDDPERSNTATKSAVVMLMATVVTDVYGNPRLRLLRLAGSVSDVHRATNEIPLSSSDPSSEIVARMLAMPSDTIIDAQMSLWVPPVNRCSDSARGSADCIQVGGQVKAIVSIKDTPYSSAESVKIADVRSTCDKCEVVKRTYSSAASLPQWSEVPGYQVESDEKVAGVRQIVLVMPMRDVGQNSVVIELQDKWDHFRVIGPARIEVIPPARFTADSGHPICSYRHRIFPFISKIENRDSEFKLATELIWRLNDGKSIVALGREIRTSVLEAELPDVPFQFREETQEKLQELFHNSGDALGYRVLESGVHHSGKSGKCSEMSIESGGIASFDDAQFCRDIEKRLTDFLKVKSGDGQASFPHWGACDQIVAKVSSSLLQSHTASELTISALDADSLSSEYKMSLEATRFPSWHIAASDTCFKANKLAFHHSYFFQSDRRRRAYLVRACGPDKKLSQPLLMNVQYGSDPAMLFGVGLGYAVHISSTGHFPGIGIGDGLTTNLRVGLPLMWDRVSIAAAFFYKLPYSGLDLADPLSGWGTGVGLEIGYKDAEVWMGGSEVIGFRRMWYGSGTSDDRLYMAVPISLGLRFELGLIMGEWVGMWSGISVDIVNAK